LTHERPKCRYQARDAAGVRPLTFHGLRHTAASLFIRKMDIQIVKTIMGHARCPKHAYENHQNRDFRNQTWGR
jgi:integrase